MGKEDEKKDKKDKDKKDKDKKDKDKSDKDKKDKDKKDKDKSDKDKKDKEKKDKDKDKKDKDKDDKEKKEKKEKESQDWKLDVSAKLDTQISVFQAIANKFKDIDNYILKESASKEDFLEKVKKSIADMDEATQNIFLTFINNI